MPTTVIESIQRLQLDLNHLTGESCSVRVIELSRPAWRELLLELGTKRHVPTDVIRDIVRHEDITLYPDGNPVLVRKTKDHLG
jgi:hypothetical protein